MGLLYGFVFVLWGAPVVIATLCVIVLFRQPFLPQIHPWDSVRKTPLAMATVGFTGSVFLLLILAIEDVLVSALVAFALTSALLSLVYFTYPKRRFVEEGKEKRATLGKRDSALMVFAVVLFLSFILVALAMEDIARSMSF
ncbi:MAG: hypothetical protein NWT12_01195 [Paracoccaceae bacterium]|nr:hypothetical protein [Paracoccaceae bacterium]